eukprot:GHVH01003690.1.p1 GENE.GHVH01003690.1~~GHVH01003690.1.p1  ORF type:complete len:579 (+),score=53.99 GHVH01003690.1:84-1820(+)
MNDEDECHLEIKSPMVKRMMPIGLVGLALRVWILWFRQGTFEVAEVPRHESMMLAREEFDFASVYESVFRYDMMISGPVDSIYDERNVLFPASNVQTEAEGLDRLSPRPVDIRYENHAIMNAGAAMSPLSNASTSTPLWLTFLVYNTGAFSHSMKGNFIWTLFSIGSELILVLTSIGIIYYFEETLCDSTGEPLTVSLPPEALLATLYLNPLSLYLYSTGSLSQLYLLPPLFAIYGSVRSKSTSSTGERMTVTARDHFFKVFSIICRIMCVSTSPGFHLLIEFACLLSSGSANGTLTGTTSEDRNQIHPWDYVVWAVETIIVHICAVTSSLYLFVNPLAMTTLAGFRNGIQIFGHVVANEYITKMNLRNVELSLSPAWLTAYLLMKHAVTYFSVVIMIVVVGLIGLLFTLRVALTTKMVTKSNEKASGQFVTVYASLILVFIYFSSQFRIHLHEVLWIVVISLNLKQRKHKAQERSTFLTISVILIATGALWSFRETSRWIEDYTTNTNLIFFGNMIFVMGVSMILITLIADAIDYSFENITNTGYEEVLTESGMNEIKECTELVPDIDKAILKNKID